AFAVLHHDKPALQSFGMANGACRHVSCGGLKHLFHEHRAVREASVFAIGGDRPGRCIDDMELLRTLALISRHRPTSQRLIGGAIGIGYMQIPRRVDYGLRVRPVACRGRIHLPMRCDGARYQYSCYAYCYIDSLHDPVCCSRRDDVALAESLVQQGIELGPNLIFLGTGEVAGVAAVCDFGGRSFWLMMIEIEVAPAARSGKALGILDRCVGAIERSGEIAPPRRLGSRTVGVLPRQRELQLLENVPIRGNPSAESDRRRQCTGAADGPASARCCSRATGRGRPLRLRRSQLTRSLPEVLDA